MPRQAKGTFPCPHCGADVPMDSIACPECGSDEDTGWSQEAEYDDLDLPTGYGKEEPPPRKRRSEAFWRIVAIGMLILFIFMLVMKAV